MKLTILCILILCAGELFAQEADSDIRKGNAAYKKGDRAAAITNYEKARNDKRGAFNLGNAYYRQDSVHDARNAFEAASALAKDPREQARAFHNLGNSWLREQKWEEAINAYKQALKRSPSDDDTRYNLAYAQKKKQEQEQKDKNKDQKEDQDKEQKQEQQPGKPDKPQPQQQPGQMDRQDAERMLDAMQQQEKETQQKAREKMKVRVKKPIEKDW